MEKYPNITLDLVPIGGNSDDYNAKFQMGASANNLPDLMNTSYGWVKQWAGTGVIMQLDDIVAEIGGNYKNRRARLCQRSGRRLLGDPLHGGGPGLGIQHRDPRQVRP